MSPTRIPHTRPKTPPPVDRVDPNRRTPTDPGLRPTLRGLSYQEGVQRLSPRSEDLLRPGGDCRIGDVIGNTVHPPSNLAALAKTVPADVLATPSALITWAGMTGHVLRLAGRAFITSLTGAGMGVLGAIAGLVLGPIGFLLSRADEKKTSQAEGYIAAVAGHLAGYSVRTDQNAWYTKGFDEGEATAITEWSKLTVEQRLQLGLWVAHLRKEVESTKHAFYVVAQTLLLKTGYHTRLSHLYGNGKMGHTPKKVRDKIGTLAQQAWCRS